VRPAQGAAAGPQPGRRDGAGAGTAGAAGGAQPRGTRRGAGRLQYSRRAPVGGRAPGPQRAAAALLVALVAAPRAAQEKTSQARAGCRLTVQQARARLLPSRDQARLGRSLALPLHTPATRSRAFHVCVFGVGLLSGGFFPRRLPWLRGPVYSFIPNT